MPCTALRGCVLSSGVADIREPSRSRGFIFVMAPIYPLMTGKRTTDTSSRGSYDVSGGPLVIVDRSCERRVTSADIARTAFFSCRVGEH